MQIPLAASKLLFSLDQLLLKCLSAGALFFYHFVGSSTTTQAAMGSYTLAVLCKPTTILIAAEQLFPQILTTKWLFFESYY